MRSIAGDVWAGLHALHEKVVQLCARDGAGGLQDGEDGLALHLPCGRLHFPHLVRDRLLDSRLVRCDVRSCTPRCSTRSAVF